MLGIALFSWKHTKLMGQLRSQNFKFLGQNISCPDKN